ncbi:MAG TPA: DMT family transporter [Candidatus Limnocylindrales bacterium]|nr:DMT family transporter [Candidatus Limnocylindrales bacterium]
MIRRLARRELPATLGWGIGLAVVAAAISGVSIFLNGYAVRQLPDAAVYTTVKNGIATVILVALAAATLRPAGVRAIPRRDWGWLALIGVVGGSVPFVLFFTGLAEASAPSAAFIQKTLFVWVAVLAVPLLGERLGWLQVAGLGVLIAGQALILQPAGIVWGTGETLIAAATLLWAVETIVIARVLRRVPGQVVASARLGIGLVVLVGYLIATGRLSIVAGLGVEQWRWALITGVLLAGYVATWFGALRRAPASAVTAILVLGAPVTAALAAVQAGGVAMSPSLGGQTLVLAAGAGLAALALRGGAPGREPTAEPATASTRL